MCYDLYKERYRMHMPYVEKKGRSQSSPHLRFCWEGLLTTAAAAGAEAGVADSDGSRGAATAAAGH